MGDQAPPKSAEVATIVVPLSALSALGKKVDEQPQVSAGWFSSLDFYKLIGGGICAVVAAMWTLHLYWANDWKESGLAIASVTRSIDEISFFCTDDGKPLGIQHLGKLMLASSALDKEAGKATPSHPSDGELLSALCAKAVFDARQNIASARTRVVRPWIVWSGDWQQAWSDVLVAIGKVTSYGIGQGGVNLKELERAWRSVLTHKGL